MKDYSVDYFIKKFEAIPENKICTGNFRSPYDYSRRCFMGHCLTDESVNAIAAAGSRPDGASRLSKSFLASTVFDEARSLTILFAQRFDVVNLTATLIIYDINNGNHPDYKQSTPKQRILAALYDIKKAQQPEVKERIVYVTVDEKVRELQKTLQEN